MSLTNTRFVGYYGILWDFLETWSFTSVWYLKAEIDQPMMCTTLAELPVILVFEIFLLLLLSFCSSVVIVHVLKENFLVVDVYSILDIFVCFKLL